MAEKSDGTPPAADELTRSLGMMDLVLLAIGTVIGSGIFLVPSVVLRQTGGQTATAMTVWIVAGILSLLGALTFAELGAMKPEAGGLYAYIRDAFGPLPAFLFGWTSFVVIASGSIATLAVAFGGYASQLVPLGRVGVRLVALAVIAVTAAVNVFGTRKGATLQNWTTGAKVVGLVGLSTALIIHGDHGVGVVLSTTTATPPPSLLIGFGAAMIGVLWAYEGWQYVTYSAGETRDPQRTFPRAITLATAALIGVYILANLGYIAALGPEGAAQSEHVAVDAVRSALGRSFARFVGLLVLVSIFSAANGIMLSSPRMYYAMARDGVFFKSLASVSPRFGTPALAIISTAVWSAVLAATGSFEQLLTYVVFIGWFFYGLGAMSVFVYRRRQPDLHRPFRVPGYPVTPLLFVASAALLVVNTLVTQPGRAVTGVFAVLLGTPAFYLWRARSRPNPAPPSVTERIDAPRP